MEMRIIPCDKRGVPPPTIRQTGRASLSAFPAQKLITTFQGARCVRGRFRGCGAPFFAALRREERGLQDGKNQPL